MHGWKDCAYIRVLNLRTSCRIQLAKQEKMKSCSFTIFGQTLDSQNLDILTEFSECVGGRCENGKSGELT